MKRFLLAATAVIGFTSASYAADPASEAVDVWSGYYVGVQGGYGWGDMDYFFTEPLGPGGGAISTIDNGTELGSLDIEGGAFGAYYGRNWQNENWVFGLDGSVSIADISDDTLFVDTDSGEFEGEIGIKAFTTSRGKIGYAFDNFMVFAAGGLSLARLDIDLTGEFTGDAQDWTYGWTIGAGVEAKLAEHWSFRVEYLYINYQEDELFEGTGVEVELDPELHVVRGGVAYHF